MGRTNGARLVLPSECQWLERRACLAGNSKRYRPKPTLLHAFAGGRLWHPTLEPDFEKLLQVYGVESDLESGANWLAALFWGQAPSPVIDQLASHVRFSKSSKPLSIIVSQLLARPEHQLG